MSDFKNPNPISNRRSIGIGRNNDLIIGVEDGQAKMKLKDGQKVSMTRRPKSVKIKISDDELRNLAAAPDVIAEIVNGNAKYRVRKFSNSVEQGLTIPVRIPKDFDKNQGIKFDVDFYITEATGPSAESVGFKASLYKVTPGNDSDGTFGDAVDSNLTAMTYDQHVIARTSLSSAIDCSSVAPGDVCNLKFVRNVGIDDNYGQKVGVKEFNIFYETDDNLNFA